MENQYAEYAVEPMFYNVMGIRSYPEYISYVLKTEYVDDFYKLRAHHWTLGVFLDKMKNNLDSAWLLSVIGDQDEILWGKPLDGCLVMYIF